MAQIKGFSNGCEKRARHLSDHFIILFFVCGLISLIFLLLKGSLIWTIIYLISVVCFFLSFPWEHGLFGLSVVICLIFILSPLILILPKIGIAVSNLLSTLKTSDYKNTYIESLGSMLGSFLAITGALWLERRIKDKEDADQDAVNARIIYYDLYFAFKQIKEVLVESNKNSPQNTVLLPDEYRNYCKFAKEMRNYLVLIDEHWIHTISALPDSKLSGNEREHLYQLYDQICNIRRAIENCPPEYTNNAKPWDDVYLKMFNFISIAPEQYRPEFATFSPDSLLIDKRCVTETVWKILKKQAKIH